MNPTRFPGGLSTSAPGTAMAGMGQIDPSQFHSFFTDFNDFTAADWVITEIGAGGTQAIVAGDGGLLAVVTDVLDNDAVQMQTVVANFLAEARKKMFFKARLKVSKATESDLLFGLALPDTTAFDVTDGIFFMKDDGDANLDVYVKKDSTTGQNSELAVATIAADTYLTLGFEYDGVSLCTFFVNDAAVSRISASSTYLPDATLAVTLAIRNGEAGAQTLTVDYVFAAKER